MPRKVQVTLTGNESKRLIARAAVQLPEVAARLHDGRRILLVGGTTVSAMSEELGFGPMRISGRIDAGGTRSALHPSSAPQNLMVQNGQAVNADKNICAFVEQMDSSDLIVVGANAIDPQGRAALAFASLGGGSRGYALHAAYIKGIPMLILCGLNTLIPDLGAAMAQAGLSSVERSMGAAIGLYNVFGPIVTELKAFEILFGVQAVTIAGSGDSTVSWPPSTARTTRIFSSLISSIALTYERTLIPINSAQAGPTCPVSPSVARSPAKRRSKGPAFSSARERVRAVARVSAPPNFLSESSSPLSQPIAMAYLTAFCAAAGPMVTAVISTPGLDSLILTAASTACRSSGLSSASTPSRIIVPVVSSIFTVSTAGTCFTSTAICKLPSSFEEFKIS